MNSIYKYRQLDTWQNAIKIQKVYRGYRVRRSFLPSILYSKYISECKKTTEPKAHLIPQSGETEVFIPQGMPEVILKKSGRKQAIARFHTMQKVRSHLDSQKIFHLIIPKARLCGDFLVEERLPINVDNYYNMGLYVSNPKLFDEAVRDLIRLFSIIYITHLVASNQLKPIANIKDVNDFIRYDKLPLYITEENGGKRGKIGLIDLEHTQEKSDSNCLETVVRIFPYHFDLIIKEAANLKRQPDLSKLSAAREKGLLFLKVGYINHLEWLNKKGAPTSIHFFQVDPKRSEALVDFVTNELLKLNRGKNPVFDRNGYPNSYRFHANFFLTDESKTVVRELAKCIVSVLIKNITTTIQKNHEKKQSEIKNGLTESELISLRSIVCNRDELYNGVYELILHSPQIKFSTKSIANIISEHISEQLSSCFMEELAKSGDIFLYDPAYYTYNFKRCWIRY